jgi:hypothetical protein
MKITDFEVGKRYTRKCWEYEAFILVQPSYMPFIDHRNKEYSINYNDLSADDWEEYKKPIDYGTRDKPKLYLLSLDGSSFWVEGCQHMTCENCVSIKYISYYNSDTHTNFCIDKKDILKVIDLPNKEL